MKENLNGIQNEVMEKKRKYIRHYEETAFIPSSAEQVFSYADNFDNFSSHMNNSSWMMDGGKMKTEVDEGRGQKIGSHIRMNGKVFGINLYLDEVITKHEVPHYKEWHTVGKINLIVIDHYTLGYETTTENNGCKIKVFIDYNLPSSPATYWLGLLFGEMYAKWCVKQMINGVKVHFK